MAYIPEHVVAKLKEVDCREVARWLNIPINRYSKAICFLHREREGSLHFRKDGKSWYCYGCGVGGNAISLVQKYLDIDFVQACQLIGSRSGIYVSMDDHNKISVASRHQRLRRIALSTHKSISLKTESDKRSFNTSVGEWIVENAGLSNEAENFLFNCRKIKPEVVESMRIKSISNPNLLLSKLRERFSDEVLMDGGFMKIKDNRMYMPLWTPCLLFPYYDEKMELVGLQTRYLGSNPAGSRFLFIGGTSPILFNAGIMATMKKGETLLICEGPTDCMALLSAGYKTVALPSASIIPDNCEERLSDFRCMYSMDRDDAGRKVFYELRSRVIYKNGLMGLFEYPTEYNDYGEYYAATH